MGFFKKLKEKVSKKVEEVSSKVSKVSDQVSQSVSSTVERTTEAVKKTTEAAVQKTSEVIKQTTETFRFDKIKVGLTRTRATFQDRLQQVLGIGRKIDEELLDDIEEILITADIGVSTTETIIESLRQRVKEDKVEQAEEVYKLLKEEIKKLLIDSPSAKNDAAFVINEDNKPQTILVIGVNGVGKTTTIGKLAYNYKATGKDVIIGAADTFRAAANEQLEIWAERAGVDIVQQDAGADPAAVAYDTLKSAQASNKDIVIIDTAGRLHNKNNLMAELGKMSRVLKKLKADAPDEVFLVLDATTGQNAILQAKEFQKVADITGIVLTKLDGTAKGGVIIPIVNELQIPVRYVGVGEQIDDLQVFDPIDFIDALFGTDKEIDDELNELQSNSK